MFSISGRYKRTGAILIAAVLTIGMAFLYFANRLPPIPQGTLRIGFEQNPPLQFQTPDGLAGLGVEAVSEAAKRAGLRIQWVEPGTSSEEAFRKGLVDLWPVMADRPERRRLVHFSRPWLHSGHTLLVRSGSPVPDRGFAGRIGLFRLPLHVRMARGRFPSARLVQFPVATEVLSELCKGTVAAGFLEFRTALGALQAKPAECAAVTIRTQNLPDLSNQLAVASTFEAAGAADMIRREIGSMFRDGTMALMMAKYPHYGLDNTWASYDSMEAAQRARWLAVGISALTILLAVIIWFAFSARQRRRAEAALRESEERFRNMADTAPVMIWVSGPDKLGTFFNKAWLDFTGRTMEQEFGEGWISGVHPDDLDHCLSTCGASFDARRAFQIEFRLRRADGEYRWMLDTGVPRYRHGEFIGFIGSCLDLTERKLIEERLRGSETRLKDAQRLARIGSWERDLESGNGYWSDEMFRIYGLRNDATPTLSAFLNYVYLEDRQKLLEAHQQVRSSDAPVDIEFRIIRPDGEVRCVHAIIEGVRNDSGAVVRMVGATQDITDQKRAQEEVFARQKLESVGTLASGIAHDFNNLLGGVLAQTELAQAECAAGFCPDEELNAVRQLAIRGSEIVRQLMIYAGKEREVFREVDVSRIVEEMLALLRFSVSKHALLEPNLGEGLPPVRGSGAQIRQIVMNLVTNASEAIGEQDGVIRVTTRCVTLDRTAAMAEGLAEGDYLQLKVSDTGRGMEPEVQGRMFDPFFTTKSAGRGLGLSVVDGIVRGLHGVVHVVASEPGKGTTFEILLPCAKAMSCETAAPIPPAGDTVHPFRQATVLVVEDEKPLREAVAKMLRQKGFEVLEAHDGAAAIDLLRSNGNEISLILLDMTMPGPSSHEVVAEAVQARPDVRVILNSAYSEEIAMAAVSVPQIRGFLRKPFRLEDLMQTLWKVLSSEDIAQKEAGG